MTDYLDALTKLMPISLQTRSTHRSFSWEDVEAAVGFPLPQDYKALVSTYAYRLFGNYLTLYSPFDHASPDGFIKTITMFSGNIHEARTKFAEDFLPFDIYPYEPLVPLGFTDDMGLVLWKSVSDHDVIVTIDADNSSNFGEYQKSLSQFIYDWVIGDFIPYGFDKALFVPI